MGPMYKLYPPLYDTPVGSRYGRGERAAVTQDPRASISLCDGLALVMRFPLNPSETCRSPVRKSSLHCVRAVSLARAFENALAGRREKLQLHNHTDADPRK